MVARGSDQSQDRVVELPWCARLDHAANAIALATSGCTRLRFVGSHESEIRLEFGLRFEFARPLPDFDASTSDSA
jgi:hypothetical protein